ncbi:MAG: protein kinase [Actinomycetota bacterium]|nr:protein kinase [Actinomycetota bacterium]
MLGSGAMGDVWAAWDHRLHRPVAVKLLRDEVASQPGVRARFEQEARTAGRLVHPNVVTVFDTGEEGATAFLVMEQLSGRTLADDAAEGPLPTETVRHLGLQVLDALVAAHHIGLVHRDIKPSNLLVAGPLTWKVGDFGIAKSVEATDPGLTSTGLVIGTPAYLAPERIAGAPASASSDLYALGLVLHEAATGSRVWRPHALGPPSVPRLEDLGITWAPTLSAVIQRAVDPDQTRRFSSAAEMAAHLHAEEPAPATTVADGDGWAPTATATAILGDTTVEPPIALAGTVRSARRRRGLMAATAVALVLLAGVVVALAVSGGVTPAPSTPTLVTSTTSPPSPTSRAPTGGTQPTAPTSAEPTTAEPATATTKGPAPTAPSTTGGPPGKSGGNQGHGHGGSGG